MTTSDLSKAPETRVVEMVFPNQASHNRTLFGGDALRLYGHGGEHGRPVPIRDSAMQ